MIVTSNTRNLIPAISSSRWSRYRNSLKIFQNPISLLANARHTYGDIFRLASEPHASLFAPLEQSAATIFLFGEENIHQLMRDTDIFYQVPLMGKLLPPDSNNPDQEALRRVGGGLLSLNGAAHTQARQLMRPAFHRQQVEGYAAAMVETIAKLLPRWSTGVFFDIKPEIAQLVLHTAGVVLLGVDFTDKQHRELARMIQDWLHLISNPLLFILPYNLPATPYHRFLALSQQLDQTLTNLVRTRHSQPLHDHNDVLSILLQSVTEEGGKLSETEIVGHVHTLFAAGLDATSNAILWLLLLLHQHPHVTKKLYSELKDVLQGRTPTAVDFKQLPYLDQVVKEGLRIAPSWLSLRMTVQPTTIGGFEIPSGSEVIFSHFHTHRDEQVYQDPYRFYPERWESIEPSPYQYIPFSTGRRMCIGVAYAQLQIKLFIAILLQRYRFQLAPQLKLHPIFNVTLGFKQAIPLAVYPQDGMFNGGQSVIRGGVNELVKLNEP